MKQLTDKDIAQMIGTEFAPDDTNTRHMVRSELRLSQRIPHQPTTPPQPRLWSNSQSLPRVLIRAQTAS